MERQWKPTMELRWALKQVAEGRTARIVKVLEQKWIKGRCEAEWREIPLKE